MYIWHINYEDIMNRCNKDMKMSMHKIMSKEHINKGRNVGHFFLKILM